MWLKPEPIGSVPEETARVARAAFPKGNTYTRMRDELGVLWEDEDFAGLFPTRGQPALAPWRLALVTVMQFAEGLSDRQAADEPEELDGPARLRGKEEMRPAAEIVQSPYDTEARYSACKREVHWVGYKAHLSETCQQDSPNLITDVQTTIATSPELRALEAVHRAPKAPEHRRVLGELQCSRRGRRDGLARGAGLGLEALALRRDGEDPFAARHHSGGDQRGAAIGVVRGNPEGSNTSVALRSSGTSQVLILHDLEFANSIMIPGILSARKPIQHKRPRIAEHRSRCP